MIDCFALLGLPRRPLPDQAEVKEHYLREAARLHPDASAGDTEKFRELQEAFKTVSDPSARLRHLLTLEFPEAHLAATPMQGDLFMEVGQAVQTAREVVKRREQTHSPLAKALLAGDLAAARDRVKRVQLDVEIRQAVLQGELADLDAHWPQVEPSRVNRLASDLAFVNRWSAQLSEWDFQLAHD